MRVTLDFPAAEEILQEVGLDEQGDAQMFHTKNVLRRIQKYMPYRTGATIKLTVAQTDPSVPEIVTEEPQRETAELYKNKEFPCRRALGSCACGCRGRRTGCRSGTLYWKEVWRMSELEQVIAWLRTYEGHDILKDWHVDYTDQVPSCGAVFPQGLQEIERRTYITGAVCVTNQSNFGLYFTFAKSAGDDEGAKINADWVNDFQHWVQEQSAHGLAPNFGDAEEPVIARAQNGVLYEAEAEGTATYMVVLSLRYTKTYESEDFA